MKLIYQFLYLINGYLFFRCLIEEVFEEEKNENKKGNRKLKDRNDEILDFDLVFVG